LLVVAWPWGGSTAAADAARERDWRKVINQCISKVENSDAVFYRRRERTTGKQLARQMREYLNVVLRVKSVPDPFGRNAGIVLAMITTHEGIAFDGITGPPEPCEVEVGGKRMKVYDWLKKELGLEQLPGEEPGHEVLETLYEVEIAPELLARWDRYIDKCIEVVRRAKDVTFLLKEQVWSPADVAAMMESNRTDAIRELKRPELKERGDKERYNVGWVLVSLTSVAQPKRECFSDEAHYSEAVRLWATRLDSVIESDGTIKPLTMWVESKAEEPPRMPKLKKKGKKNG
jgi:hypothetical protein